MSKLYHYHNYCFINIEKRLYIERTRRESFESFLISYEFDSLKGKANIFTIR